MSGPGQHRAHRDRHHRHQPMPDPTPGAGIGQFRQRREQIRRYRRIELVHSIRGRTGVRGDGRY